MLFLPPMTGNFGTGSQKYTTYKNADDWGMVYGIVCPTLYWFIHVYPCLSTGESKIFQDILSTFKAKERNWWWLPRKTTSTSSAPLKQPCRTAAFTFPVFPVDDHNNIQYAVHCWRMWDHMNKKQPSISISISPERNRNTHNKRLRTYQDKTCCAVHPICCARFNYLC